MPRRLPCCRHCGWLIYLVPLADGTELWHDNVHDDIRCLINGVHEPTEYSIAADDMRTEAAMRTAVSGQAGPR